MFLALMCSGSATPRCWNSLRVFWLWRWNRSRSQKGISQCRRCVLQKEMRPNQTHSRHSRASYQVWFNDAVHDIMFHDILHMFMMFLPQPRSSLLFHLAAIAVCCEPCLRKPRRFHPRLPRRRPRRRWNPRHITAGVYFQKPMGWFKNWGFKLAKLNKYVLLLDLYGKNGIEEMVKTGNLFNKQVCLDSTENIWKPTPLTSRIRISIYKYQHQRIRNHPSARPSPRLKPRLSQRRLEEAQWITGGKLVTIKIR